jgi:hypothetical protein
MYEPSAWRVGDWANLVNAAKQRELRSGLIQLVAEVIERLRSAGTLARADAIEYLANSRVAWRTDHDPEGEEPLDVLVERLDAAVLGLVEALDADAAELPVLLDEALNSSLWARQIARENVNFQSAHKAILRARANLIWQHTTPPQRKGHFAMGLGLDAGLAIDAVSEDLENWMDVADFAAIRGDADELADALAELGEALLAIRPFVPEELPADWKAVLRQWVSGVDVNVIGVTSMRTIEDAFSYRLVWALEALRTRRVTLGFDSDLIEGGAAASLETGVPSVSMSLLIRSGLPSRTAAIAAVQETEASFLDGSSMVEWLRSNEIVALTDAGGWPSDATASLWKQFRDDVLAGPIQKWTRRSWLRRLDQVRASLPTDEIYRVEIDDGGDAWIATADYRRVAHVQRIVHDLKPSIYSARFEQGNRRAVVERLGRGTPTWEPLSPS